MNGDGPFNNDRLDGVVPSVEMQAFPAPTEQSSSRSGRPFVPGGFEEVR